MIWEQLLPELRKKAFPCGQGGLYFKEYFFDALRDSSMTLQKIAQDERLEIVHDFKTGNIIDETRDRMKKCLEIDITTDQGCYKFFKTRLELNILSYPELCGSIVGALIKKNMYDEAVELLELNIMDENEMIAWDS